MSASGPRPGSFLHSLRALVRLRPHDTSTEDGRAWERYRRAVLTGLAGTAAKGLFALVSLASIPLTIGYLGKERYGLWAAINVLLTWTVLADVGMGRGLQNQLADAYGRQDEAAATTYVSTAFFTLTTMAAAFAGVFAVVLPMVPWGDALHITDPALIEEAGLSVAVIVGLFLANFPLAIAGQIYTAYQRGYVAHGFSVAGDALSFVALLFAIQFRVGLPMLILALGGTQLLVRLFNLGWALRTMPFLVPRVSAFSLVTARSLIGISLPIFLFQVGGMLINELQSLVIAHTASLAEVADFNIFLKVLSIPTFLNVTVEGPLSPAFREAWARGDSRWLRSAFARMQRLKMGVAVLTALAFVLLGNVLAALLSRGMVSFDVWFWLAAGLLNAAGAWNGGYNQLFQALDRSWPLAWLTLANGLVTLPLTVLLGESMGLTGVVLATALFSIAVQAWVMPIWSRDLFNVRTAPAPAADPPAPT